ncbi:hypothetical protein [Herbaspirillum robiniae]|uniref:hypothetical protein n=1 Tax=Herbaspirillum robiniae TaxID=2014887 RepID=UPI003D773329
MNESIVHEDSRMVVRPERFICLENRTDEQESAWRRRCSSWDSCTGMDRASAGAEGLGLDHTKPAFFDVRNIAAGWTARKRGVASRGILWWWNERAAQACRVFSPGRHRHSDIGNSDVIHYFSGLDL